MDKVVGQWSSQGVEKGAVECTDRACVRRVVLGRMVTHSQRREKFVMKMFFYPTLILENLSDTSERV